MTNIIKYGLKFLGLAILQIFVLNGMNFLGYATPFFYIYFLIKLPVDTPRNLVIFLGFALGLIIDIFCNTPGINAGSGVLIGFLRPYLIRAFVTLEVGESREPSVRLFRTGPFLRYAGLMILIHHVFLLLLESFSLLNWKVLLLRIACCSVFTFILIWASEGLARNGRKG